MELVMRAAELSMPTTPTMPTMPTMPSTPATFTTARRSAIAALAALAATLVIGCKARDERAAPAAKPVTAAASAAVPEAVSDGRAGTQDQLAEELDAAAQDVEGGGNQAVQRRWQGKRVRWTVTRLAVLCGSAEACYVQPFATARRTETSAHGWMPQLGFAAGEYEKLAAGCGEAASCAVTVEGTIDRLTVSDELPTSLHLADVQVVKAG
jgi:hypothetical protein